MYKTTPRTVIMGKISNQEIRTIIILAQNISCLAQFSQSGQCREGTTSMTEILEFRSNLALLSAVFREVRKNFKICKKKNF